MSVNLNYFKSESTELLAKISVRHNLITRSVNLQSVVIHKYDQVIQLIFVCCIGCFPDLTFLSFAITDYAEHFIVFVIHFSCKCHSYCTCKSLSQ